MNDKQNIKDYTINKTFDWGAYSHDLEKWGDILEKQVEELKEGYECALSHIKTLNDGVLMSQNIWDKVIAQADDLLNDKA